MGFFRPIASCTDKYSVSVCLILFKYLLWNSHLTASFPKACGRGVNVMDEYYGIYVIILTILVFLAGFTRIVCVVYSCTMMCMLLRVQLNIIGGYMYADNFNRHKGMVSHPWHLCITLRINLPNTNSFKIYHLLWKWMLWLMFLDMLAGLQGSTALWDSIFVLFVCRHRYWLTNIG